MNDEESVEHLEYQHLVNENKYLTNKLKQMNEVLNKVIESKNPAKIPPKAFPKSAIHYKKNDPEVELEV